MVVAAKYRRRRERRYGILCGYIMLASFGSAHPRIRASCFIHHSSQVIGDVEVADYSSVWCNAVIRGDVNSIRIGASTNIQDNCVLHVDSEGYPLVVGDFVTVGHGAILHGCTVGDRCVIGVGAIVLNGAQVGEGSVIAAGSLVPEGMEIPARSMVMGLPGKVRREVSAEEAERFRANAEHYVALARTYLEQAAR